MIACEFDLILIYSNLFVNHIIIYLLIRICKVNNNNTCEINVLLNVNVILHNYSAKSALSLKARRSPERGTRRSPPSPSPSLPSSLTQVTFIPRDRLPKIICLVPRRKAVSETRDEAVPPSSPSSLARVTFILPSAQRNWQPPSTSSSLCLLHCHHPCRLHPSL